MTAQLVWPILAMLGLLFQRSPPSISGRILAEAGTTVPTVGISIVVSPTPERGATSITGSVTDSGTFLMAGLSGSYRLTVRVDRQPPLAVTRITVDGVDSPGDVDVTFAPGSHDVVLFVAERPVPRVKLDPSLSPTELVSRFKSAEFFWQQFEVAQAIVERHDASVIPALEEWLTHDDRHIRGNTAFILARLGDRRGFETIAAILTDRSDRPEGQGARASSDGRFRVAPQIASDRYYAAHLLGDLGDARAVPLLIAHLKDTEVNSVVPWALEQIGGTQASAALIDALADEDPSMRVTVIYALEALKAKEALPRLTDLLTDHRKSNFGAQVAVAAAAKAAIAKLQ